MIWQQHRLIKAHTVTMWTSTGEGYLMQVAHGMSEPYAELLVADAPDHMQQRYRAAVQRAAEIAASAGCADSASGEQDSSDGGGAGSLEDDSDTGSYDDERDENRC
jgi:hypothetical protein